MNKKSLFIKIAVDNYISSFLFVLTGSLTTLKFFQSLSFKQHLIVSGICAIFSVVIYAHICIKQKSSKKLLFVSLVNIPLFVLFALLNYVVYSFLVSNSLTIKLNSASGIYIMFSMGIYLTTSLVLRIIILFLRLMAMKANQGKQTYESQQSGDDSKPLKK